MVERASLPFPSNEIELPGSPLPLHSPFYIDRPPTEALAFQEISKPGCLIRIKVPRKMGKSSLMTRLLSHAEHQGYATVVVDLQSADDSIFETLEHFLRWVCIVISRELYLEPKLTDYWDHEMGSKISCTLYLRQYLLKKLKCPLFLAINEINRVFEYPKIASEFLTLLRFWHEQAKRVIIFQSLHLLLAHSTNIYVDLNINHSPFNVGLPIQLPEFSLDQVQDLALRYGLTWAEGSEGAQRLLPLMERVGGHPYLIQLALYHLVQESISLEKLLETSLEPHGIYHDYLQGHLAVLRQNLSLAAAMKQVIQSEDGADLDLMQAYKLNSMGLVHIKGQTCHIACEMYRLYFAKQNWSEVESIEQKVEQLLKEKEALQTLVNTDALTQLGNRRCFENTLSTEWARLARDQKPLALILCDVDYFKLFNDTYGHPAGDVCLRKISAAIYQVLKRPADIATRYGGEEFAIILPDTDESGAAKIAEDMRRAVKQIAMPHHASPLSSKFVTLSLGVASLVPPAQETFLILIQSADKALYQAKSLGRDRVQVLSTLSS